MTEYEILLLLDAELPEDRQEALVVRARELIERGGGEVSGQEAWGRRKLAYEIDRKGEGSYHLLTFSAEPAVLDEVSRVLRITDGVLRHMAVRRPRGSRRPAVERPVRGEEPVQADTPEEAVSVGRPDE